MSFLLENILKVTPYLMYSRYNHRTQLHWCDKDLNWTIVSPQMDQHKYHNKYHKRIIKIKWKELE